MNANRNDLGWAIALLLIGFGAGMGAAAVGASIVECRAALTMSRTAADSAWARSAFGCEVTK